MKKVGSSQRAKRPSRLLNEEGAIREPIAHLGKVVNGIFNAGAVALLPYTERERITESLWWWRATPIPPSFSKEDESMFREEMEYYAFLHELEARDFFRKNRQQYQWHAGKRWCDVSVHEAFELFNAMRDKYFARPDKTIIRTTEPFGRQWAYPDSSDVRYFTVFINLAAHDKEIINRLREFLKTERTHRGIKQHARHVEHAVPWDGIEAIDRENLLSRPDDPKMKRFQLTSTQRKAASRAWAVMDKESNFMRSGIEDLEKIVAKAKEGDVKSKKLIWLAKGIISRWQEKVER